MSEKIKLPFEEVKKLSLALDGTDLIDFVIVGAGGTGGYLIRDLVRIVALKNEQERKKHTITLIDGDIVEEKNLTRQNFVRQDIGKNKAVVSAQRYGRSFGLEIKVITDFLTSPTALFDYIRTTLHGNAFKGGKRITVFVDCVDNNATRLYIANTSNLLTVGRIPSIILSSGNSERTGQVLLTTRVHPNESSAAQYPLQKIISDYGKPEGTHVLLNLPGFFDIFPNTPIDKDPTQLSCAEQAESAPQNILANITAANILFGFAVRLLNGEDITTFAVFFNTKTGKQAEFECTEKDMKRLLSMRTNNQRRELFFPTEDITSSVFLEDYSPKIFSFTKELEEKHHEEVEEERRRINEEATAHLQQLAQEPTT